MKGFIEVNDSYGEHLLNLRYIEDVSTRNDGRCVIFMAYNAPNTNDQDYYYPHETYDEVKRMIEEATK